MPTKTAPKLKADISKTVDELPTVSAKIRYLDSQNVPRADIARILNKRYQHVKNVLDHPLKKSA